jgi:hypothetical protein
VSEIVKTETLRRISCPESRILSLLYLTRPYQPLVTFSRILHVTLSWMLWVHGKVVSAFSRRPRRLSATLSSQSLVSWNGDRIMPIENYARQRQKVY